MNKYYRLFVFAMVFYIGCYVSIIPVSADTPSVWRQTKEISFSGGVRTVNAVYINLNDNLIGLETVLANQQVGSVAELKNLAQSIAALPEKEVVAAINGTSFNAYAAVNEKNPYATIQSGGEFLFSGDGPVVGYTQDGKLIFSDISLKVTGSSNHNGKESWRTEWVAYGINHISPDLSETEVLTPAFGSTTKEHDKTSIVVKNGIIIDKRVGEAPIYQDGFTITTGSEWYIDQVFEIGDQIEMQILVCGEGYVPLSGDWSNTRIMIGGECWLISDGNISINEQAVAKGNIKLNESHQRSFIGFLGPQNTAVLGTVPDVTIPQLAEIVKNMGMTEAIYTDGGASSGLYYDGEYVTAPGRSVSNALVVTNRVYGGLPLPEISITELSEDPSLSLPDANEYNYMGNYILMQINNPYMVVNGLPVEIDEGRGTVPLISFGRTLAPIASIADAAGMTLNWNEKERTITIFKDGNQIELTVNSPIAVVNGQEKYLEVMPQIINGRTMMPISFISEELKLGVDWKAETKQIVITLD